MAELKLTHPGLLGGWRRVLPKIFQEISSTPSRQSLAGYMRYLILAGEEVAKKAGHSVGSKAYLEVCNKFKGDGLEVLVEILFKGRGYAGTLSVDITDYQVAPSEEDYGVDGVGKNANNQRVVVQVKFRANPKEVITYADIARTFTDGVINHGLIPGTPHGIVLVTTTGGISSQCEDFFRGSVKMLTVINRRQLAKLVRGERFWDHAYKLVEDACSTVQP